jgi:hypothetical protein
MLSVNAEAPIEDFRRSHRACQSLELSDFQIAQGIIEGAKFKEWIFADDSAARKSLFLFTEHDYSRSQCSVKRAF